ncbi:MAG TPA: ATP-binding protein [Albitalea sp.]|nr:ATP-binding protein [Albitalea sp.]
MDIDEWREHWQVAAQAVGLGTLRWTGDGATVELDTAAAAQFGLPGDAPPQMPHAHWLALLAREDRAPARAAVSSPPPPGETAALVLHVPLGGGKQRVLQLALRLDAGGRTLIGACRDITHEHSLEDVRRQKLAAERANQAKSEFMSQVSHELRTPLNAIIGFAELMAIDAGDPLSPTQRERLQVLQQAGQRLLGLIDQLLQIGRIEQGRMALRRRTVSAIGVVQRCIATLSVLAAHKGIDIELEAEGAEDMTLRADPDALEQAVTNLLSNAIKYNVENGRVRVRLRARESGEIIVDDTGSGLTDSQMSRLFEPFNRLSAERSQVPGTGLGLVITRKLVRAMGGELDVWSQVGRGSRFQMRLPLGRRMRTRDTQTIPLDLPSRWDDGQSYCVLYIEDDEVNVVLMQQLFSTQPDWQLVIASTGAEGLVAAVRCAPRVILLDMNLPDMSGTEVLKRLKNDPRTEDTPCIAVSADALPASVRRSLGLGFDDYWTKPLELGTVIGKLKRLLRQPVT